MNPEVRNFKDFLQLYNRLTEICFTHCADNLFTRQLSTEESNCVDKCVIKFSNVNQRLMTAYVHDQSIINERRMKEMEAQVKASETAALAAAAAAAPVPESIDSPTLESSISPSAPVATSEEISSQNQSQTLAT